MAPTGVDASGPAPQRLRTVPGPPRRVIVGGEERRVSEAADLTRSG